MPPSIASLQPWMFQVQPYPDESFGHFLGRFRRANCLSSGHLSTMLGLRSYMVAYWETPSRRRIPNAAALNILSDLTGVEVARLRLMLFSEETQLYFQTRLCALCYAEVPSHQLTWQMAAIPHCDRHQRQLLSACPRCGNAFQLPAHWQVGECEYCHLPFAEMATDHLPVAANSP